MASVVGNTLFFLLFLFIITNTIHGYYLIQQPINLNDESNINEDLTSNHRLHLRSVLWPKICFTALTRRNEHANGHRLTKRNIRKCYPFENL